MTPAVGRMDWGGTRGVRDVDASTEAGTSFGTEDSFPSEGSVFGNVVAGGIAGAAIPGIGDLTQHFAGQWAGGQDAVMGEAGPAAGGSAGEVSGLVASGGGQLPGSGDEAGTQN